ncbi:MAG: glycoside hydrolase [Pseudomonadales bacterium]|nr:glycoside hydrolase [Pseudomonadales bacterium]
MFTFGVCQSKQESIFRIDKMKTILSSVLPNPTRKFVIPIVLGITAMVGVQAEAAEQKFLGNIVDSSTTNYTQYWNQVTPENSGKWESVEPNRDSYNWSKLDQAYNFAKSRGLPFKHHTFVWGNQEPRWLGGLSDSARAQEVEELIRDTCRRYPNMDMIDVVNEPLHAPSNARWGLGGSGSTGWDWIVRTFQWARQYCPNSKLLLNDYGIINDRNAATRYREIVNILKARGLIDGVGLQSHSFSLINYSAATLKGNLDYIAQAGLPVYISEWDIDANDSAQLAQYREKFPIVWEHSSVAGVTIWGYVQGLTWMTNSGLMYSDGRERPALTWLKNYTSTTTPPPPAGGTGSITVRASGVSGSEHINLRIGGNVVAGWNLSTSPRNYVYSGTATGDIQVQFDNDNSANDVILDYIKVNNETRQAEDMEYNTATYANGSCGGGSYSEIMHCNGVIGFGNTYDCFSGNCDDDSTPPPPPPPPPPADPCAGLSGWSLWFCRILN